MTQETSNQTAPKSSSGILRRVFLIGFVLLCVALWILWTGIQNPYWLASGLKWIADFQPTPAPWVSNSLPVVAISSQNMSQVAEVGQFPQSYPITSFAWSPDSRVLAMGHGSTADLWDIYEERKTGSPFVWREWESHDSCNSISPDGSVSAFYNLPLPDFSTDQPRLTLVSLRDKQPERKLGPSGNSCPIAFSPDGRLLASGPGPVSLWGVAP